MVPRTTRQAKYIALLIMAILRGFATAGTIADFDDLILASDSYWNGSDESGGFQSGSAYFNNNYNTMWDSWDGFSYSNKPQQDPPEKGMDGQYTAITGAGEGGSDNYAIGYVGWAEPPTITLSGQRTLDYLYVTNNNYAYYSMLEGDAFAKKFGGASGNDPDWLLLTITGKDTDELLTGTVEFYLADYRFEDNGQDYIVDTWQQVDLSSLSAIKTLEFSLSSSDTGQFGMNTPAYFALDTVVPEPATITILGLGTLILAKLQKKKNL